MSKHCWPRTRKSDQPWRDEDVPIASLIVQSSRFAKTKCRTVGKLVGPSDIVTLVLDKRDDHVEETEVMPANDMQCCSKPPNALRNEAPTTEKCSRACKRNESTVATTVRKTCTPVTRMQECF